MRKHSRLDALETLRLFGDGVITTDDLIMHSRTLIEIDAAVETLHVQRAGVDERHLSLTLRRGATI